jgi:antitoxin (DNA-binding transcriptional repressor) of toxin-antitoxin stability system
MPTTTIDMKITQPSLDDLVTLVQAGEEVLLMDGEKPLVRLVPAESSKPARIPGLHAGQIWASDDFDDPLPL